MKNWKTTGLGIATILGAISNAVIEYLNTGTANFGVLGVAVAAGWGLIKAVDAK